MRAALGEHAEALEANRAAWSAAKEVSTYDEEETIVGPATDRLYDAEDEVRHLALRAAGLQDRLTSSAVVLFDDFAISVFPRSEPHERRRHDGYTTLVAGWQLMTKVVRLK